MKILIVDDDLHIRQLYESELSDEGHVVVTAESKEEALERFKKESFDLVTLDIAMPAYDEGIEALRLMKDINPSVPVIMLTAYDFRDDMQVWAADGYLTKSSDLTELKDKIREFQGKG